MYLSIVCYLDAFDLHYIPEWILYHEAVGVEHFFIYTKFNDVGKIKSFCSNLTKNVTVTSLSDSTPPFSQGEAYNHAITNRFSKWIAAIDSDEFILPLKGKSIPLLLKEYEPFGGLGIFWHVFGTSGIEKRPENQIHHFKYRARHTHFSSSWLKTIFQPEKTLNVKDVHVFNYHVPYCCVDENFYQIESQISKHRFEQKKFALNHYVTRSIEEFNIKKKRWSDKNGNSVSSWWVDSKDVFDDRISRLCIENKISLKKETKKIMML